MKFWLLSLQLLYLARGHEQILDKRETLSRVLRIKKTQLSHVRDEDIEKLSSISPCSIPPNANQDLYYPNFAQCADGSCPPCAPIDQNLLSYYGIQPSSPKDFESIELVSIDTTGKIKTKGKGKPVLSGHYVPDPKVPQIEERPREVETVSASLVSGGKYSRLPSYPPGEQFQTSAGQFQPSAGGQPEYSTLAGGYPAGAQAYLAAFGTSGNCPQAASYSYAPEDCSRPLQPFYTGPVMPFQCPSVPQRRNHVPIEDIKRIIMEGNYCQKSEQCDISVSELSLRLKFLEEKLSSVIRSEARLKVYAEIIAQIEKKVKENPVGRVGPPGDVGYSGPSGTRGRRGKPGKCEISGGISLPGPPGPKGPRGKKGDMVCDCDGEPGAPGFEGYAVPGTVGLKGEKGTKGERGYSYNPITNTTSG